MLCFHEGDTGAMRAGDLEICVSQVIAWDAVAAPSTAGSGAGATS